MLLEWTLNSFQFLLVSYTRTKWILNPQPHPPPILMGERSVIWARTHWLI